MKWILSPALFCLLAVCLAATADTIVLQDGDQLSGSLVEVSDDIAVFRTELAGQLMVPLARVASITTARDVQVAFKDGGTGTGKLVTSGGQMRFVPSDGGDPYPVTASMLVSVAPQRPGDPTSGESMAPAEAASAIATGVQATSGNDDFISLYSRLRLGRDRPSYLWRSDAYLASDEGFDDIAVARAIATWRWLPDAPIQPSIGVTLERDTDAFLDLRASLTIGGYRTFRAGPRHEIAGTFGMVAETERWDGGDLEDRDVFPDRGWDSPGAAFYYHTVDRQYRETDLRLKLDLRHVLRAFDPVAWEERLTLLPSLTDGGDWRGAYESSVLFPLTDRLRLNLNLRVDYDSDPAFRYLDQWRTTVGAGVEWNF